MRCDVRLRIPLRHTPSSRLCLSLISMQSEKQAHGPVPSPPCDAANGWRAHKSRTNFLLKYNKTYLLFLCVFVNILKNETHVLKNILFIYYSRVQSAFINYFIMLTTFPIFFNYRQILDPDVMRIAI